MKNIKKGRIRGMGDEIRSQSKHGSIVEWFQRRHPAATSQVWLVGWSLFAVGIAFSRAELALEWSHQSPYAESSAVVGMDANYMFVADNEDETLRLYERFPARGCAAPVYTFNARPYLHLGSRECDLEAATKVIDQHGTRIYWLGSHSNSKSGKLRPDRYRLFATQVQGDGNASPAYTLTYLGRYDHLRTDLIVWDRDNLHGLGANYYGLAASAAYPVIAKAINAFNIEGLAMAPEGTTAYIAFRAPLVNATGPTISVDQRTNALIVPLLNLPELVAGNPTVGPGTARFGVPFTLNLGQRGVRSIDSGASGQYLITAGPAGNTSYPPAAPLNFRLFTWTGQANESPIEEPTEFPYGYAPEGAILPPGPLEIGAVVQFVSDDSGGCWRSFTATLEPPAALPTSQAPTLQLFSLGTGRAGVLIDGDAGLNYTLEASTNLRDWTPILSTNPPALPFLWIDPSVAQFEKRFYRVFSTR